MQLDDTRLAVRERSFSEILDLSFRLLRIHAWPLALTMTLGAAPFALLNQWLIGWMANPLFVDYEITYMPVRYVWTMSLLVALEAPLASTIATAYLGHAVFHDQPSIRQLVMDAVRMLPRLLWCHGVIRGVGIAIVLALVMEVDEEFGVVEAVLIPLAVCVGFIRAIHPFMNEMILLEKIPIYSRDPRLMTIQRRNQMLHMPSFSMLVGRWLAAGLSAVLITAVIAHTFLFLQGVFLTNWHWDYGMMVVVLPLSMWIVAGYMTVVRFLSYLDLRIRHEGWEVELRLRAEAGRLASRLV